MWVLHLGLIIHLRLFKSPINYFKMNLHVGIAYKLWFSLKGHPKLHISDFEMTQHVGITFRVGSTPKVT